MARVAFVFLDFTVQLRDDIIVVNRVINSLFKGLINLFAFCCSLAWPSYSLCMFALLKARSWVQPFGQSLVATARFVKFSNLILKDGKDIGNIVAGLQLGGKRMYEKVFLSLLFVGPQGTVENSLEV